MTRLSKVVKRATEARVGGSRPITVELVPPFLLRFRERGRRVCYELTIQEAYVAAAKRYAERAARERAFSRKALRKPVSILNTR